MFEEKQKNKFWETGIFLSSEANQGVCIFSLFRSDLLSEYRDLTDEIAIKRAVAWGR